MPFQVPIQSISSKAENQSLKWPQIYVSALALTYNGVVHVSPLPVVVPQPRRGVLGGSGEGGACHNEGSLVRVQLCECSKIKQGRSVSLMK